MVRPAGNGGAELRLKIRQAADVLENYELSGRWKDYQAVVTYGWLQRANESPRLIPLSISTQAHFNKKLYWCRGRFTAYKVFSRHRLGQAGLRAEWKRAKVCAPSDLLHWSNQKNPATCAREGNRHQDDERPIEVTGALQH